MIATNEPSQPRGHAAEFDAFAKSYDAVLNEALSVSGQGKEFFANGRIHWLARLCDAMNFRPETVLDFGCGTGTATPLFFDRLSVRSVTGVDVSPASLDVAREAHGSSCTRFLLREDYEPDGTVDLAFCNGVFHHIPPAERPLAVEYVCRALRPGGLFAFWENNSWNPGARYCMWVNPFDQDAVPVSPIEARRMLLGHGFEVVVNHFLFVFPRSLGWFRWLEPYLCRLPVGAQYLILCRKA